MEEKIGLKFYTNYEMTEEYRRLRTNIKLHGKRVRTIVFTSCHPGEGKSEVSIQTAMSLCQLGNKVIYVDSDLRKPSLEERVDVKEYPVGLSQYLAGISELESIIIHTATDGFDMITSGAVPPNPTELLAGEGFKGLLTELKAMYDYIVIDSPPCDNVVDAVVIANVCDGVVIVIQEKRTSKRMLLRVKTELARTNTILLGAVLNKVDFNKITKYKKYKRYYKKQYVQRTGTD